MKMLFGMQCQFSKERVLWLLNFQAMISSVTGGTSQEKKLQSVNQHHQKTTPECESTHTHAETPQSSFWLFCIICVWSEWNNEIHTQINSTHKGLLLQEFHLLNGSRARTNNVFISTRSGKQLQEHVEPLCQITLLSYVQLLCLWVSYT